MKKNYKILRRQEETIHLKENALNSILCTIKKITNYFYTFYLYNK